MAQATVKELPDVMTDDEMQALLSSMPDELTDEEMTALTAGQPQPRAEQSFNPMQYGAIGGMTGALKGVGSSAYNIIQRARQSYPINISPIGLDPRAPINQPEIFKPTPGEQQAGYTAEQLAEFLIPAPNAQIPKTAAAVTRAANVIRNAAAQGGVVAGVSAAHNATPEEIVGSGLVAAGTSGVSELLKSGVPWLRDTARKLYESALNPTKVRNKEFTTRVVPELIARQKWYKSLPDLLQSSQDELDKAGTLIDDYYQANGGKLVDPRPLIKSLESIKDKFRNAVKDASGNIKIVDLDAGAISTVDKMIDLVKEHGTDVSLDSLRKVKQIWFDSVTRGNAQWVGRAMPQGANLNVTREGAFALLNELNKSLPDLAKINAEFTFWKRVNDIARETATRKTGQMTPLYEGVATIAGAATGTGLEGMLLRGAAAKMFTKAIRSPMWKTFSAVQKDRLANAIMRGRVRDVNLILSRMLIGIHQTPESNQGDMP